MKQRIKSYRYELIHIDDSDHNACKRSTGDDIWETVSVWMIPPMPVAGGRVLMDTTDMTAHPTSPKP